MRGSCNQVAIGVPRSGTHFLSTVLGWHHERCYNSGTPSRLKYEPEVSWAAAPYVDPKNTLVIHIVRHPLKVLASNIHRDWLKPTNSWGRFAYKWAHTWDIYEFYVDWFRLCESKAHVTIKLEDIQHLGEATNRFGDPPPIRIYSKHYEKIQRIGERYGYEL